jgi:hypothetical protein
MKRSLFAALIFGFAALTATPSTAARQVYSGQDLINNCKNPALCDEFLLALLDSQKTLEDWYQLPATVCPPVDLGMNLFWGLVRAFFDRTASNLEENSAGSLTMIALENALPCVQNDVTVTPVMPRFRTGIDLVVTCSNPTLCQAFLLGVLDTHRTLVDWGRIQPLVCLPEETTNVELMVTVMSYLQSHGDEVGFSAGSLILLALSEAHGCS